MAAPTDINFQPLVTIGNNTNELLGNIAVSLAAIVSTGAVIPGFVGVPASATAPGVAGQLAYNASFLFVCVAADTWRRVAIAGGF